MNGWNRLLLACGLILSLFLLASPMNASAHAALERSEPAAGETLTSSPTSVRIWFTEPLEQAYTGAELLDASGEPIAGATSRIAPDNAHELILDVPEGLADGSYTVAWRTLSSADGHTLDGYFGFQIGAGSAGQSATVERAATGGTDLRPLSRGVALIGLAALLAIAPLILGLFDPLAGAHPAPSRPLDSAMRRYAALASVLAVLGSFFALAAQAKAIAPDASVVQAMVETLGDTRYGQLWLLRLALLVAAIILVAVALGRDGRWRRPALIAATLVSLILPLPFSLLSHAAAQTEGRASAVASDAIHLLFASLWAGGLFMLTLVLVPAIWRAESSVRNAALRVAIARFSVVGIASWAILVLSGLYASWLQVGDLQALIETDYGQTLLLKGLLLLPVLLLAAFHFALGWRGAPALAGSRLPRTLIVEACIVVAVFLVVGRLIGLEPAREVIASREPSEMRLALTFPVDGQERTGSLVVSPGVAGNNTFTVDIEGAELPAGSEAVLRFALPSRNIGEQELRLPATGPNTFRTSGSELSLVGSWEVTAIVRKIGDFSWRTGLTLPLSNEPPVVPSPNPPPRFEPIGVVGMVTVAAGLAGLAVALLARGASAMRRGLVGAAAVVLVLAGAAVLQQSRLPGITTVAASQPADPADRPMPIATPAATPDHTHAHHMAHATPEPLDELADPGTPVISDGLTVTLDIEAPAPGPVDVSIVVEDDDAPVTGASIVVLSELPGMEDGRVQTSATETEPGRYLASGVPLTMPGEWQLAIRISPKGKATRIVQFQVVVDTEAG